MKKTIIAILVVLLLVGLFAFSAFGEETTETTVTFAPHTADDGTRQYCACGNKFIADANGTVAYVNGEDGCKNYTHTDGTVVGCQGELLSWSPWKSETTLPTATSGNYYLVGNADKQIEITGQQSIAANVNICLDLNGVTTYRTNGRLYSVHNTGVSLVLTDTAGGGTLKTTGTKAEQSLTLWARYGTVIMYGGTVDASGMTATGTNANGPCVSVNNGAQFHMFGGTLIGGTTEGLGSAVYLNTKSDTANGGIFHLYGGTISGGHAKNGGAIYANSTATLNIYGGSINGGTSVNAGGCIFVNSNAVCTIYDGTITGGSTAKNGGCIYVNGALNIKGGTVQGGESTANCGGNVYVAAGKSFEMTGGTVTGGISKLGGGNIHVLGEAAISAGAVSNGVVTGGGGGNLLVDTGGNAVISGGIFSYGSSSAQGGNLRVESGAAMDIQGGRFEYGGIDPATGEVVTTQGGNLVVLSDDVTISGGTFIGGKAKEYAGNIRVGKDLTLGSGVVVQDGESAKGGNLSNNSGGTLTIDGATITGGNAVATEDITNAGGGGNIYVESSKTLEIKSGTVSDGTAANYGGNIYVNSGTLLLSGGMISGGQSQDGGSVALRGGTAHSFTGGTIDGGHSNSAGGNLFVGNSAKLTIDHVTITGGKAEGMGGGLYMGSGTVTVNNCLIQGNEGNNGGNVAVYAGTLNFNDGEMVNGIANNWGGNVWTDHGTVNIAGGEITGGSAKNYGGGIALANTKNGNRTLNITGGTISGNSAPNGGGLYIHGYTGYTSNVTISGGTISGNTATKGNGGGLTMGTSFCGLTITGDAVIKDNTATGLGGNLHLIYGGTKLISGGTITGGTAKSGNCINVEGKSVTISGTPTIDAIRVNNVSDARLEVSDAAWTTPVSLELTGAGAFATATTDKTACFATVGFETVYEDGTLIAQLAKDIYVSANGADNAAGTQSAPVQSFERAMEMVADGGTIHLVGAVSVTDWEAHGKTFTVTGGELVLPETRTNLWDNVTFDNLTLTMPLCTTNTSSNFGSYFFYCNGYTTVIEEDVTVRYFYDGQYMTDPYHTVTKSDGTTATATSTLYGGGPSTTGVLTGTNLTVMAGRWGNIYGGSNATDIEGDVHLTVGGKINEGVDYASHTNSNWHIILGGSRSGNISGTVYMNVTGGMNHTSTHGGSNGNVSIGAIEMRVTGGNGMAIYGGGRSGGVLNVGTINFYYEGGTFEQVFGGTLSNSLVADVNLYVTGGNITRRLYGGCYSNCDESSGNWTADNFVTGNVNLYIGSGANISCDLKDPNPGWESILTGGKYSDRGIYGHSRRAAPGANDAENARIIFLDQAAYNKHKGNLKAQDTVMSVIMKGVTAADYICYLGTNASGNVITVGATEVEDNASDALDLPAATATITVAEGPHYYEGSALTPATVTYSENWTYGDLQISYADNDKIGTATASITYEGATAAVDFAIEEKPCEHTQTETSYAQVEGTQTHTVTVTCQCGEQISQTTETCADPNKDYLCDNCGGELKKPVAQVGEDLYTSLSDAIANAGEGYVKLLADCTDALTLDSDLYLDLNGYSLSDVTVSQGHTLYLLDSATDDYQGAYGTAVVSGTVQTLVEANGKTYLVVAEDGKYSAHCYEVKLTHVSLDASNDALGYKAQLFGDEMVMAHVTGFGFDLWVDGGSVKTYSKTGSTTLTLRLKNIMAAGGGEMNINANAFVTFDVSDEKITSPEHTTTMKDTIVAVNALTDLSDAQKAAVCSLYEQYSELMDSWLGDTNNIKSWKSSTDAS